MATSVRTTVSCLSGIAVVCGSFLWMGLNKRDSDQLGVFCCNLHTANPLRDKGVACRFSFFLLFFLFFVFAARKRTIFSILEFNKKCLLSLCEFLLLLSCVGFSFSLPVLVLFYFKVKTFTFGSNPASYGASSVVLLAWWRVKGPFAVRVTSGRVHESLRFVLILEPFVLPLTAVLCGRSYFLIFLIGSSPLFFSFLLVCYLFFFSHVHKRGKINLN